MSVLTISISSIQNTLDPLRRKLTSSALVAIAALVGTTRLIDNILLP